MAMSEVAVSLSGNCLLEEFDAVPCVIEGSISYGAFIHTLGYTWVSACNVLGAWVASPGADRAGILRS